MVGRMPRSEATNAQLLKSLQQQFKDFNVIKAPNQECPICSGQGKIKVEEMYGVGKGELPCYCTRMQSQELAIAAHRMTLNTWATKYCELLKMLLLAHGCSKEAVDEEVSTLNSAHPSSGIAIINW